MLPEVRVPSLFKGLVVTILTAAPMPPEGNALLTDLYTSTAAIPWEEISPKLNDLPPSY